MSKKQEKTETLPVVKKTEVALTDELTGSWGSEAGDMSDIIIPKVLLMHGQSSLVLEGERTQGQLIRSTDHAVLAERDGEVEVIPFMMMDKKWVIVEVVDGKKKIIREEAWTAANDRMELDFEEGGKKLRRDKTYRFMALLPGDESFPVLLEFSRTSLKAGKTIADHFAKSRLFGKPAAMKKFSIGSEFVNGEKHKYFVFTSRESGASTLEEIKSCKQWHELINTRSSDVVIDDTVEEETTFNSEKFNYSNVPF